MLFGIPIFQSDTAVTVPSLAALLISGVLFGLAMHHAYRTNRQFVPVVVAAGLFGLIIECINMKLFGTYYYDKDLLKILNVPLYIMLAWLAIIYGAMLTSDRLGIRWFLKPMNDGLLALTIDLTLDPVAVAMKLWVWGFSKSPLMTDLDAAKFEGLTTRFLGIPLSNYFGWFWLVYSFSFMVRLGFRLPYSQRLGRLRPWLIAFLSIPSGMVMFYAGIALYGFLLVRLEVREAIILASLIGIQGSALALVLPASRQDSKLVMVSMWPPLLLHAFIVAMYFYGSMYKIPEPGLERIVYGPNRQTVALAPSGTGHVVPNLSNGLISQPTDSNPSPIVAAPDSSKPEAQIAQQAAPGRGSPPLPPPASLNPIKLPEGTEVQAVNQHDLAGLIVLIPSIAVLSLICFGWPYRQSIAELYRRNLRVLGRDVPAFMLDNNGTEAVFRTEPESTTTV